MPLVVVGLQLANAILSKIFVSILNKGFEPGLSQERLPAYLPRRLDRRQHNSMRIRQLYKSN